MRTTVGPQPGSRPERWSPFKVLVLLALGLLFVGIGYYLRSPREAESPPPAPAQTEAGAKTGTESSEHKQVIRIKSPSAHKAAPVESVAVPVPEPAPEPAQEAASSQNMGGFPPAIPGTPFQNSLGMSFIELPGTKVWFCVWDVRVEDYTKYAATHPGVNGDWQKPGFKQGDTHPVVNVSWEDAQAFCRWLTERERGAGVLRMDQRYRLPTDAEWSVAVGVKESNSGSPKAKDSKVQGVYPWGKQWPPPRGAGNYGSALEVDDYATTSPVGSFRANRYGLYDVGGNVWQWCEDFYDGQSGGRVLRGGSWGSLGSSLLSSFRYSYAPDSRFNYIGFRCVLETGSQSGY